MLKKVSVFIILLSIISACAKTEVQPEPVIKVSQYKPGDPRYKLDMQFDYVIHIAQYFQTKSYSGDRVYYTDAHLQTPEKIKADLDYLSDEGINYLVLLRSEILARNDARFDKAVIQRIFNSTFWYNQFASKKGMYSVERLNIYEKENVRRIGEMLLGQ